MDMLRSGSRDDLERLILKKIADFEESGEQDGCFVGLDRISDQLETSDEAAIRAWISAFCRRAGLTSKPHADGIIFVKDDS